MGGQINWSAIEYVAEMLGVQDVEQLINDLVTIQGHVGREDNGE